jgi:hypothetical protein
MLVDGTAYAVELNLYAREVSMRKISFFVAAALILAGVGAWVASTTQAHVDARIDGIDACAWQSREESRLGCPSMIEMDFANWISPLTSPVIGSIVRAS